MSAAAEPSPVQQAASPVAGGWVGFSGLQKIGMGVATVAGLAVLVAIPDLFGTPAKPAPTAPPPRTPAPEEFDKSATPAGTNTPLGSPPRTGGASGSQLRVLRRPPPTPIAAYENKEQASRSAHQPDAAPGEPGAAGGARASSASGDGTDSLSQQVSGAVSLDTTHASVLRNPDYVITAGTKFECRPREAINSSLGGFVSCIVPDWVRGTTQRRGLLPPGSLVFGQIRNGLSQGQRRLGVLFTRIETAGDHMVIPMAAPGADAMGRAGLPGEVETFFWDQVGATALYALIGGVEQGIGLAAGAAAGAALGGTGGPNLLSFGGGGGSSLAATALGGRMNRPPELTRPEAQPILVSVGQDLDFFKACRSRMRVNPMACPVQ